MRNQGDGDGEGGMSSEMFFFDARSTGLVDSGGGGGRGTVGRFLY